MGNCTRDGDNFACSPGQIANIILLLASVSLFIFLIFKDAVKSLKSKAHWIPGDFLVLSALTIQLLNLISTQGQPLSLDEKKIGLVEFWMIHTSRILLCVVIAYLVPAMANPGAEDYWGKITSLAITVFLNVITQLYILLPHNSDMTKSYLTRLWPKQQGTSPRLYYILAAIILTSFLMLLLLLGCANIAGRAIERIVAHRIPLILKAQVQEDHQHHHHHYSYEGVLRSEETEEDHYYDSGCKSCWQRVENAVLRGWIVARAYSLEYIIARSVLASSAAIILSAQIAITIVAGVWKSKSLEVHSVQDRLRFSITMMQCLFILIGWSMVLRRWVTAVAYYGSWSSCFRIEDFWTRHLRDLQQKQENELPQSQLLKAKIDKVVANQSSKITLPGLLLYGVIVLQWYTVSFSKACWFASQILFRNPLTGKLLSTLLSKLKKGYSKYEAIMDGVQMLGETPNSLLLSNRRSIPIAVTLIQQGKKDAEPNCQSLVDFVATERTSRGLGLSCLEPNKPQTGLKYLCKRSPIEGTPGSQEEHFTDVMSTKPWKMTSVALLSIIIQFYPICAEIDKERASSSGFSPAKVVKDCMKAYSVAWEFMDFIEDADEEADRIASEAADKYFRSLEAKAKDDLPLASEAKPHESVTEALAELKNESKRKMARQGSVNTNGSKSKEKTPTQGFPKGWKGNDSIDWKAEAWASAVYELCNSIECNDETDVSELLKELQSSLADIINECLQKIQHIILVNSRKWALHSDERRIAKALYTTGKASVIMEKLESSRARSRAEVIMEERSESAIVPMS
ncbi:hypothetical protein SUGI_0850310 [Cryptomeria japonica]|nr:hypothetical protein SUGI_0850310 [Cryptomeria japonica]